MKKDIAEFLKAAIKNPMEVSTIFPTSKALAQRMLKQIPKFDDLIVEVGVGTGAITQFLAPRIESKYLGIEISPEMVSFMREHYPKLHFEQCGADKLLDHVKKNSVSNVVSSLPWSIFPESLRQSTLDAIYESLEPGGRFITYVCLTVVWSPAAQHFLNQLNKKFKSVERSAVEWRNIPPAFVFTAHK